MLTSIPDSPQTAQPKAIAVRFHLSLNVSDIQQSVSFYERFFGCAPAKHRSDYAKFEIDEPPLVLSLEPAAPQGTGSLNHVGLRLADPSHLKNWKEAIEARGIPLRLEEGVECCYASQDKFWLHSPDGVLWEVYTLVGDLEHRGGGQAVEVVLGTTSPKLAPSPETHLIHRLDQGHQVRFSSPDNSADSVALQGSLNLTVDEATVFAESYRVLKPGGVLRAHVLTADRQIQDADVNLPGPAAVVRHVPEDRRLVEALVSAGFIDVRYEQLAATPCFHIGPAECRQTKLEAIKPAPTAIATETIVLTGPIAELRDDRGLVFRRGERVLVDQATRIRLESLAPGLFTVLRCEKTVACGFPSREPRTP